MPNDRQSYLVVASKPLYGAATHQTRTSAPFKCYVDKLILIVSQQKLSQLSKMLTVARLRLDHHFSSSVWEEYI